MYPDKHTSWGDHAENLGGRAVRGATHSIFSQISGCIWSIIIGVMVMCMVGGALVYAFYLTAENPGIQSLSKDLSGTNAGTSWSGSKTLSCDGHEKLTVSEVKANVKKGWAIDASGHCTVTIEDSKIKGKAGAIRARGHATVTVKASKVETSAVAIKAEDHAKVNIKGGSVKGKKMAAEAAGHARVTFSDSEVSGETSTKGRHAKINGAE